MSSRGNRTFICTVVFIDIVEYSKKSVTDQMQVKEQLNALLAGALADVPDNDRIILDTGDGAAVSFLGDPEEGLYLGLALRDALTTEEYAALRLRTGINLGPVRLVKDINGQPNIIGDGINVAQRVMSFADVNQVLASRSYYEVVSALSPDYAHLFRFGGARTDKHVREHEVYVLGNDPAPERAPRHKRGAAASHAAAAVQTIGSAVARTRGELLRRPPVATAVAVILILGTAVAIRVNLQRLQAGADAPAATAAAPTPAAPDARDTLPTVKLSPQARVVEPGTTAVQAAPPAARKAPPADPGAAGVVRLSIIPWGEVHVDDKQYGVAPPLRDIALKPGQHRIEVRNPGFASFVQIVDVDPGEEIRIRHQFR